MTHLYLGTIHLDCSFSYNTYQEPKWDIMALGHWLTNSDQRLLFSLGRVQVEMSLIIRLISGDEIHSLIYILMKNYQFLKRPEGISTKLGNPLFSNVIKY